MWLFLWLSFLFVSCSRVCTLSDISSCISERTGKQAPWLRGCDPAIQEWVNITIQKPLSKDEAIQIALLQNPNLQVLFERIGIATADLVQAGLFRNPIFDSYFRFPNEPGFVVNTSLTLTFYFIDLLLMPLKKRIAAAELTQIELEVTHAILDIAYQVEKVYHLLAAEKMKKENIKTTIILWSTISEIFQETTRSEEIKSLTKEQITIKQIEAEIELAQNELLITTLIAQMNQLLGFEYACWEIDAHLPTEIPSIPCLETLQEMALENRFDFRAIQWQVEKIAREGALKNWWTYTDFLAGISSEKQDSGEIDTGPTFHIVLPLFDWGQAAKARHVAQLLQSINMMKALKIKILSEVAQNFRRIEILNKIVNDYQGALLKHQGRIVDKAQEQYKLSSLGEVDLLLGKIQHYQYASQYLSALRDLWIEYIALKQSLDGDIIITHLN